MNFRFLLNLLKKLKEFPSEQYSSYLIQALSISSEDLREISLRRKSSISLEGHVKINKGLLLLTFGGWECTRVNVTDVKHIISRSLKAVDAKIERYSSTIISFDFDVFR